ncbi:MAG: hypothetical protein ACPHK8_04295 [Thermoplasmatota archaeon]
MNIRTSLLIGLLLTVSASAQIIATDPPGDHSAPAAFGIIDLLEAGVSWNQTHANFSLSLSDLNWPSAGAGHAEYVMEWNYGQATFQLAFMSQNPRTPLTGPIPVWDADLWRSEAGEWQLIASLPEPEWTNRGPFLQIPFSQMTSKDGHSPGPGEAIQITQAWSVWDTDTARHHEPATAFDLAQYGDELPFPADAVANIPGQGNLALGLATPEPIRFSNGAATTHHWPIRITNPGPSIDISLDWDAPTDVSIDAPAAFAVESGQQTTVHVFATTPFRHNHGETETITLRFSTAQGSTEYHVGIHYPLTPQPAGHHPNLWLHGAAKSDGEAHTLDGEAWMNANEEDPNGSATRLAPALVPCGSGDGLSWWFPLHPELLIGLAPNGEPSATFDGQLVIENAHLPSAELTAGFAWYNANGAPPSAADWDTISTETSDHEVDGVLGSDDMDLSLQIPFQLPAPGGELKGVNFGLGFKLCPTEAGAVSATNLRGELGGTFLRAGGKLSLPLNEYHDPITEVTPVMSTSQNTSLVAPGGSRVVWAVAIQEPSWDLRILGPSQHLASVGQGESENSLWFAMMVPADAETGDQLEATLLASSPDDPSQTAALRFQVRVDADAPLIAAEIPESKATPAPLATLVLGLITLALLPRRPH